jgi:hypothetical protein
VGRILLVLVPFAIASTALDRSAGITFLLFYLSNEQPLYLFVSRQSFQGTEVLVSDVFTRGMLRLLLHQII